MSENSVPLIVDLDGTLIKTDLLLESAMRKLKAEPLSVVKWPAWLAAGKAQLKKHLAENIAIDFENLPYNNDVVEYCREQKQAGREIVLATASYHEFAEKIAEHLQLFDRVLATDLINLSASNKANKLVELYGEGGFDYIGNHKDDVAVWKKARKALVVSSDDSLVKQAASAAKEFEKQWSVKKLDFRLLLKAMRIHQWTKNILVLVPLFAVHHIFVAEDLIHTLMAFFAFGCCASSVYLLNDLFDLDDDRRHRTKCNRPFACGDLSIIHGLVFKALLLLSALILSALVSADFMAVLFLYYATTLAYSMFFKHVVMLDVVILSVLYTFRIVAGSVVIGQIPSFWLLAFSIFIFLSLAMVKRYTELTDLKSSGGNLRSRGYYVSDLQLIAPLGAASGFISVLVMALYINSEKVRGLYENQLLLWLICPVLLYWVGYVWITAHRGEMHDDPIVFALKDKTSRAAAIVMAVIVILAV